MQLLNLTLSYLLQETSSLIENSFINKLQELDNDKFKLKLRTANGTKNLFLFPLAVFFSEYKINAKKHTSGFGAFLRKRIEGKKILAVSQHNSDRIIQMELQDYYLILELFLNGNIILTDKEFKIISAFKKDENKNRKISKGELYLFPESAKLNPKEMGFENFKQSFEKDDKENSVLSVISCLEIAPIFVEEIFFKLNLKKEKKLTEKDLKKVFDEIKKMYSLKEKSNPVKVQKGKEFFIIPFPLTSVKKTEKINSINSALDEFYSKEFFSENQPEKKSKKLIGLEYSFGQQLDAEKKLKEQIELNKIKAEAIYLNNLLIQEIIDSAKKGLSKDLKEKEIKEKINVYLKTNNKEIELISLTRNKVLLNLKEK